MANAEPGLPERSAAQLLVDLQSADPKGLSGTVVQSADLGLPGIAGLLGSVQGDGSAGLTSLIAGSNTARVWYAGEEKARFALLGTSGETDVIRNGSDVWIWESAQNTGTHLKLPAGATNEKATPSPLPSSPQEAAEAALSAIDDSTKVETTGQAQVAGRNAYELVLSPKAPETLVGQVRLAIDAEEKIPLRVDVYAKNTSKPAFRVAFEQISFTVPADDQFTFNPPPGAKVTEGKLPADAGKPDAKERAEAGKEAGKALEEAKKGDGDVRVVGEGWATIVVAKGVPSLTDIEKATADAKKDASSPEAADAGKMAEQLLGTFQKVSGSWGSGRLLSGSLFTALLTDDGRVLAGAVTPEALYQAAGQK